MRKPKFLTKLELKLIADEHPHGITSFEIVKIFQEKGFKFSEATLRKYIQMGLVERCKRIGTKGKHRGSHGVYPIETVGRINSIKRAMVKLTLEQLQCSLFPLGKTTEEAASLMTTVKAKLEQRHEPPLRLRKKIDDVIAALKDVATEMEKLDESLF